jgi:hypothetical protein
MTDMQNALKRLAVGDIFHAEGSNGASLLCLVTAVDEATIYARRIHTQDEERFDRKTGFECGSVDTKINCIAPLPSDVHAVFVRLDQRYQEQAALIHKGLKPNMEAAKWTPDERHAHNFLRDHISTHPV